MSGSAFGGHAVVEEEVVMTGSMGVTALTRIPYFLFLVRVILK